MSNALTPALTVTSNARVRRRRELPLAGEVIVSVGDVVAGDTVVARAQREGELRLVRVGEVLGIPGSEVPDSLQVKEGATIAEGQILAEIRGLWGLFRSSVTAPISGVVEFVSTSTGHVGIRAPFEPLNLTAYMAGRVVSVEPTRSVVIEADATFVQGIFGVGGERLGTVHVLDIGADTVVREEHIPSVATGAILVGGHSPTAGAIRKAVAAGAVGFITGSIDDATLCEYLGYDIGIALTGDEDIPMTLIITEGFGVLPMSERVLHTLRNVQGQRAAINGATQVRAGAIRPELLAPMSSGGDVKGSSQNSLHEGARIRVIRVPYFGVTGTVRSLPHELVKIETGAMLRVLYADLDDGRRVMVPRANVELL